ncbi:hypothetical protein JHK84_042725 [Glycine max]|nr:hypothetical protein JHK84_042725 [Glycine max]
MVLQAIFNGAFFSMTGSSSTALFIGSSASTLVATLHEFEIDSHNIQFVHWDYMMQEVPGKHNDHSNTNGWKGTGMEMLGEKKTLISNHIYDYVLNSRDVSP